MNQQTLGKAPAVNPSHGESTRTRKTEYRTDWVQSRCRHRSCATRSHAIGASRRDDLTKWTEIHRDRTALRGSPRLAASASEPRSKGVYRSEQGSPATPDHRVGTRHPSAATEAATSRRHIRQRRPFDARELPPQAVSAPEPEGSATSTTRIGSSGCTPNALARPSDASQHEPCVTTDPHPRGARTRCLHQIQATWFRRTSGCPPCRHGRRHTTHAALHRRGAPRRGTLELRPKPQPSHVAPWNVRQRRQRANAMLLASDRASPFRIDAPVALPTSPPARPDPNPRFIAHTEPRCQLIGSSGPERTPARGGG